MMTRLKWVLLVVEVKHMKCRMFLKHWALTILSRVRMADVHPPARKTTPA